MALFGSLGKAIGLGTARETVQAGARGALMGGLQAAVMAQPFMGGAAAGAGLGALTRGTQQGQATAVSVPPAPPAETAFSGEAVQAGLRSNISYSPGIQPAVMTVPAVPPSAGMGATRTALPAIIGGAGRALMLGGGAIAVAPMILDPLTGEEKKLRVTRRLRSQVKKAVEMFGVEAVSEQMGADPEVIFYILTKKMRNDGPYVTKAAVRKTRQTVRKMKHLCDMYDDLRPAAKRRAPARTTSRVTQIKN